MGSKKSKRHRSRSRERSKKSKHKRERRESTVSVSSDDEDFDKDVERAKAMQEAREQARLRRQQEKQAAKALETPEEKRERRLQKKLAKEAKRRQELGYGEQYLGYSNMDNPFGDNHLTETFVWTKKLQKAGVDKVDVSQLQEQTRQRIMQNQKELEYFKKLRDQREKEREDREMIKREEEAKQFNEWQRQEDRFHLQQAKLRSKIRVKENRAEAVDVLARYIAIETDEPDENEENDDNMQSEIIEPYEYLNGLSIRDLEDLLADIKVYRHLENIASQQPQASKTASSNDVNDFWRDIAVVAESELARLKQERDADRDDRRDSIHGAVKSDVEKIFQGKSYQELALLETNIMRKVRSNDAGVDVTYWESLLTHLKAHMARARLRERHQSVLKKKLERIRKAQLKKDEGEVPESVEESQQKPSTSARESSADESSQDGEENKKAEEEEIPWNEMTAEERAQYMAEVYDECRYSPVYTEAEEGATVGREILTEEDDATRIRVARLQQQHSGHASAQGDSSGSAIARMEAEARKGMTSDEATFAVEAPLEQVSYLWSDKYKPRKPRYFNRVTTGFEWNKYNQTHYDLDNPPPKVVQGYRFSIFYPDLLDTTVTPQYNLYECEDKDFAILRFRAGPPYEDIAFKIVNGEWDVDQKHGFKCCFQNGIMQLWFTFKKWRYRR